MGSPAQDLRGNTRRHLPACLDTTTPVRRRKRPSSVDTLLLLSLCSQHCRSILTLTRWLQHRTFRVLYQCSYPEPHRVPSPISTVWTPSSQQKDGLAVFPVPTLVSAPAWKIAVSCLRTLFLHGEQEHLPSQTE